MRPAHFSLTRSLLECCFLLMFASPPPLPSSAFLASSSVCSARARLRPLLPACLDPMQPTAQRSRRLMTSFLLARSLGLGLGAQALVLMAVINGSSAEPKGLPGALSRGLPPRVVLPASPVLGHVADCCITHTAATP